MAMLELLLYVFMALTLMALLAGLYVTFKGGNVSLKYSNALMRWRVLMQGISIILLGLLFWVNK